MANKALQFKAFNPTSFDAESGIVEGYASIFGNIDQIGDVVERGAFAKTIAQNGSKVRFLWQHNRYEVIGKIIELREDAKGLFFRAQFANTGRGQEARELLKMEALGGFSIGYHVVQEARDSSDDGRAITRLKELRLLEISAVTFPCNEDARPTGVKELFQSTVDRLDEDEAQLLNKFAEFLISQREIPDDLVELMPVDVLEKEAPVQVPEVVEHDTEISDLLEKLQLEQVAQALRSALT